MQKLKIVAPTDLDTPNLMPNLGEYGIRFLAEGDSWFTIGALNPLANANLLYEMRFAQSAVAVNCATPGDTLQRMADTSRDPAFVEQLTGPRRRPWDALLLSCGGNDLIDALAVRGAGIPPHLRLLLDVGEWGDPSQGAARYLSDAGWQTFSTYLRANLDQIVALRDAPRSQSKGVPIFLHGYAVPTPRPAPAGPRLGPWLLPSVQAYGIPEVDYEAVATLLIGRLAALLAGCAAEVARYPNLHFFDTTTIPIAPAAKGSAGVSGDWVNEIHLTRAGCEKLARPWAQAIEAVIVAQRG